MSIIVAMGITALIGQAMDLVFFVTLMIIMIGLAVGIDHSLVIISRYRDELARGLDTNKAVERAGATAGRTVLFSGLTVVIALCGILIVPFSFFQSLGLGAVLVVLVALAATLTLLPANLAVLGPRINHLPVPFFGKARTRSSEPSGRGFWELITRTVTRFPVISIIVVGAPMIAATVFYFQIHTGLNGVDAFPEGAQTREAFFVMEEEFSFGLVNPTEIVIDGNIDSPGVQEAMEKLQASLTGDGRFLVPPTRPEVSPSGDLALLTIIIPGEPRSQPAVDVVSTIRDQYVPAAFDGVPAEVFVGGVTAEAADVFSIVRVYTPIVFAFVLGCSFLILMLVFRSIVIPIKAVFMNLLSVGAACGLVVLVFQKGVATDLLGFQDAEVIDVWIPLFLFLHPLRPVHGLPRIPAEPHRGAIRSDREQRRSSILRAAIDRWPHHRHRPYSGRGIRRVPIGKDHHQPAGRIRAVGSHISGCNAGAFRPSASQHGTAGPAELVPAVLAELASGPASRTAGNMRFALFETGIDTET